MKNSINKKILIIFLFFVLILLVGGFFYYQKQPNFPKNFPKEILIENESPSFYKIINQQYGYSFLLPKEIDLSSIEYIDEDLTYHDLSKKSSAFFASLENNGNLIIETYKPKSEEITLNQFIEEGNPIWSYKIDQNELNINGIEIIQGTGERSLGNFYNYIFKGKENFYFIENASSNFIESLILKGEW